MSDGQPPLRRVRYARERNLADDERWVDPAAPDSNQRPVGETLLQSPASASRFVPLMTGHRSPEAGRQACQQALETIPRPFDVVVLGLGQDGHTASLFPGAAGLEAALAPQGRALCAAVRPPGELQPGPADSMPIRAVLRACRAPIDVYSCP